MGIFGCGPNANVPCRLYGNYNIRVGSRRYKRAVKVGIQAIILVVGLLVLAVLSHLLSGVFGRVVFHSRLYKSNDHLNQPKPLLG